MNRKINVPAVLLVSAVVVQTAINRGVIPITRARRERKINKIDDPVDAGSVG